MLSNYKLWVGIFPAHEKAVEDEPYDRPLIDAEEVDYTWEEIAAIAEPVPADVLTDGPFIKVVTR